MLNRRFKEANRPPEGSSWCWLTAEMLDSPAWRALAGNAMKVVMRIALEHLKHGGVENGKLPVTYQDFVKCGVRRNSVRQAILIAIYLGWIDKTSTGEVPWHGDIRKPSTFALTWLPRHDGVPPSNRWKRFESDAEAKAAIRVAKAELAQVRRLPPFFNRQGKPNPTPESVIWSGDGSDTCTGNDPVLGKDKLSQNPSNDSRTPFYISARTRRPRVSHPPVPTDANPTSALSDAHDHEQPDADLTEAVPIYDRSKRGS
jgi:hypothetical protein